MADGRVYSVERDGMISSKVYRYPTNGDDLSKEHMSKYAMDTKIKNPNPSMKLVISHQNSTNIRKTLKFPGRYVQQPSATSMCLRDHVDLPVLQRGKREKKDLPSYSINSSYSTNSTW